MVSTPLRVDSTSMRCWILVAVLLAVRSCDMCTEEVVLDCLPLPILAPSVSASIETLLVIFSPPTNRR